MSDGPAWKPPEQGDGSWGSGPPPGQGAGPWPPRAVLQAAIGKAKDLRDMR
jgi:hypothetical protein